MLTRVMPPGKTLFLLYLLVTCLGKKRAVALQLLDGRPFYALFNDSVTFHSLNDRKPLIECHLVWALSDSNNQVQSPSGIFLGDPDHIRVIQTTPPKAECWKVWSEQVGAQCFIMDIWSEEELENLASVMYIFIQARPDETTSMLLEREAGMLSQQDVVRMATLVKKWGGVPRTILQCIQQDDQEIERQYHAAAIDAVWKCRVMVSAALQHALPDEIPSKFYSVRPLMTANGIVRQECYVCVPTSTLRSFLGEALKGQDNLTKLNFFNSLSLPSETRQAARYLYESWFHSFFSAGKTIEFRFVTGGSCDAETLEGTKTLISAIQDIPKS